MHWKKIKIDLFDKTIITLFFLGTIVSLWMFFRKSSTIEIVFQLDQETSAYSSWGEQTGTKPWFSQKLAIGATEKDGLGKTKAEITNLNMYDISSKKQTVFVTAKIKTTYTKASNTHSFKGRPVAVGETITLNLNDVTVKGVVVEVVGDQTKPKNLVKLNIETRLISSNSVFPNNTGVDDYIANAINVGDTIRNYVNAPIITVDEVTILPAKTITTSYTGELFLKPHPQKKDVYLNLTVTAYKVGNKYFLFEDVPLKIDESIPLNFPHITIYPVITNLSEL